jgi:hypothetical protein
MTSRLLMGRKPANPAALSVFLYIQTTLPALAAEG